jgi:branched-chain amino acid transport system permease protein
MSPAQTSHGAVFALYGVIGVSLVVLTGWGGQISLGQFGFAAIGALVGGAATGRWGLPFAIALLLGALAASATAVGVGIPALRIRGLFLAVSTLAFAVAVGTVVMNHTYFGWLIPTTVPRPKLLWFDTDADERTFYYLCLAALGFAIFVAQSLRRSRTGRVLIAMRDNEQFSRSHGIDVVRTRLAAFGVSGFLAGLAGVLYVHHQESLIISSYGAEQSIAMFLMAVIGGLGNVYTVLMGALYLGITTVVIDNAYGRLLASAFGVLAILLFYPQGIGALLYRIRDAWLRRIALRNRIAVPSLMGDRTDASKVALAERLSDIGDVPSEYELPSAIGTAGRSQLSRVWKYD